MEWLLSGMSEGDFDLNDRHQRTPGNLNDIAQTVSSAAFACPFFCKFKYYKNQGCLECIHFTNGFAGCGFEHASQKRNIKQVL